MNENAKEVKEEEMHGKKKLEGCKDKEGERVKVCWTPKVES